MNIELLKIYLKGGFSKALPGVTLVVITLLLGLSSGVSAENSKSWKVVNGDGVEINTVDFDQTTLIEVNDSFSSWLASLKDGEDAHPFINGLKLSNAELRPLGNKNLWAFNLRRTSINDELWPAIRSRVGDTPRFTRDVVVSFGVDRPSNEITSRPVRLILAGIWRKVFAFGIIALLSVIFIIACRKSNVLRHGIPPAQGLRPPLSLSTLQMALWLFVIIASFLFIWIITGSLQAINDSVLLLIGISSGTFLSAALIESTETGSDLNALAKGTPSSTGRVSLRKTEISPLLQLLSDNDGVSLHRFQMFAWTVVLTLVFTFEVLKNLSMPVFSSVLLGVMGISSGTYLGFKFPELKKQDSD